MRAVTIPTAAARAAIARGWLGDLLPDPTLGVVTLRPHQRRAVARLRRALRDFGGALLADAVGLGKTYVALALARDAAHPLVVAPAALRSTWERAATATGVPVSFASFEALSRGALPDDSPAHDLVIVDEAHHARNPATRRWRALATLAAPARVLLLSATPVHNRPRDIAALLALFLGERAAPLDPATLARVVVRRTTRDVAPPGLPVVRRTRWLHLPDVPHVLAPLRAVPPPLPPRDGGHAGALWSLGLVHLWASSDGALRAALRRRLARATALGAALDQGRHLSRHALRRWAVDESTVQLELPLLDDPVAADADLRPTLDAHERALRAALDALPEDDPRDRARAALLRAIRRRHAGERVLAFTQFADTARALFRHLASDGGVALLTGDGGRVAGGALSRHELVGRFAPHATGVPPPRPADRVDLLLATDCLSEGLDLHDASVVVHLDLPWTPARLAQRVGRAARLGSPHPAVTVYAVAPPGGAAAWLRLGARLHAKAAAARDALGPGTLRAGLAAPRAVTRVAPAAAPVSPAAPPAPVASVASAAAAGNSAPLARGCAPVAPAPARPPGSPALRIARVLERWAAHAPATHATPVGPCVAGVATGVASADAYLALCLDGGRPLLLAGRRGRASTDPRIVARAIRLADAAVDAPFPVRRDRLRRIVGALRRHARVLAAAWLSGSGDPAAPRPAAEPLRRAVLARCGALVASAPPHARARVATEVARVRAAAERPWGAGVERAVAALASLPDERWLPAVLHALQGPPAADAAPAAADGFRIVTILVLGP